MAGFATQSDTILRIINERNNSAMTALASVNEAIDTVRLSIENSIDELTANAIDINLSALSFTVDRLPGVAAQSVTELPATAAIPTFPSAVADRVEPTPVAAPTKRTDPSGMPSAPTTIGGAVTVDALPDARTPRTTAVTALTAPTMPTQGTVAIGDTEWARIQALAAAELARSGVTEEAAAASEASLRGLSVPPVISTGMVSLAQQRTQDRLSLAALQNAVEHAKASREDVKDIAGLDLKLYEDNIKWEEVKVMTDIAMFDSAWKYDMARWSGYMAEKRQVLMTNAQALLQEYKDKVGVLLDIHEKLSSTDLKYFVGVADTQTKVWAQLSETTRQDYVAEVEVLLKKWSDTSATLREDYKVRWGTLLENYKLQHDINRGYEMLEQEYQKLQMASIVDPKRIRAEYDLKKTEMAMNNAVGQIVDLLQIESQIATAALNASDVGMNTSTSIDNNYPFKYNPSAGELMSYMYLEDPAGGGGGIF